MRKRLTFFVLVSVVVALVSAAGVQAAEYPRKPINVLIGFAPGGGSDVMLSMVRPLL